MRFFGKTNIDFLGVRRRWYLVSGAVILAGMMSLVVKGIDYGIDFRGGTEVLFSFSRKLEVAEIRGSLANVGLGNSEIKSYGTEGNMLIRTTEQAEGNIVGDRIRQAIQQSFPDVRFEVLKEYRIWPKIGAELRRDALYAIIASLVAILFYIAIRFQFIYGVGAVMSLFHDVLVTLGIISLLDGLIPVNLEITQEVIAAFLTLVGVS
ncbi:MAG: protein translocase subunit SecF, partial [Ignavibacteriales bacterium]|nr:protein translocase subunit SecF [Ignavibacteriales bacterium]